MPAYFYLLPLERSAGRRGPSGLKWRGNPAGLKTRWSLKAFGDLDVGLVATEQPLSHPEAHDFQKHSRNKLPGRLKSWGLEPKWVSTAGSEQELLARVTGLALAYQAKVDDPAQWLVKPVHFGFHTLPAFDTQAWAEDQAYKRAHAWDWLGYPVELVRGIPHWLAPTGKLYPVIIGGALPHTDAFSGTSPNTLDVYNAGWVQGRTNGSGLIIAAGNSGFTSQNNFDNTFKWTTDSPSNDQYAQVNTQLAANGSYYGPSTRAELAGAASYSFYGDTADATYLYAIDHTGVETQLGSGGATLATNDLLKLESAGTSHSPKVNGTVVVGIGIQTDASLASGYGGVIGFNGAGIGGSFEVGNLSVGTQTLTATGLASAEVFGSATIANYFYYLTSFKNFPKTAMRNKGHQ